MDLRYGHWKIKWTAIEIVSYRKRLIYDRRTLLKSNKKYLVNAIENSLNYTHERRMGSILSQS